MSKKNAYRIRHDNGYVTYYTTKYTKAIERFEEEFGYTPMAFNVRFVYQDPFKDIDLPGLAQSIGKSYWNQRLI